MDGSTTLSPQILITDIGGGNGAFNMEDIKDNNNNNDNLFGPTNASANGTINTTNTNTPIVGSGAQAVIPSPPSSSTTTPPPTTTTSATTTSTNAPPIGGIETTTPKIDTSTTENSSSTPKTDTTDKDKKPVECPDLFVVSSAEFTDSEGKVKDDHHHTIIINNKNKAVVFDHKSRGDEGEVSAIHGNHSYGHIHARERTPGSIVTAICSHGTVPLTVTFLECQANGKWNGTLPHCHGSLDVSSSTLYFSVIGGVCGATILILALLYIVMMKAKRRDKGPASPPLDPEKAIYVDPYAVGERLYSIPAPVHYTRGDITYAKPQIYSTYLNPSFYEDAYQRWRRQEQQVSEKLYDSPFINTSRSPNQWPDNQEQAWAMNRGDTQMEKLQIPRAKISPMDQGSVRSHDSVSTLTFTGPRPQRVLYGRSSSVVSTNATMPRYSNGQIPRRQSNILESPSGMHLVKAFDDAPPPTLQELEVEHMTDGRTPF